MKFNKLGGIAVLLGMTLLSGAIHAESGPVTVELAQKIESTLYLPLDDDIKQGEDLLNSHLKTPIKTQRSEGNRNSLKMYVRYYYETKEDNKRILNGTFIVYQLLMAFGPKKDYDAPIKIVQKGEVPYILNSGCQVIRLKYDLDNDKVMDIRCSPKR